MSSAEVKLKWISEDLPEDLAAAEQQIREEIADMDMDDPMDLMFHTVFLTKDMLLVKCALILSCVVILLL